MSNDNSLNVRDACELLGLSSSHIANLARRGVVPARKEGQCWYFRRADLESYQAEHMARELPAILNDRGAMLAMYRTVRSMDAMALQIGCSKATVRRSLARLEIPIQTRSDVSRLKKERDSGNLDTAYTGPWPDMVRWMDVSIIFKARGLDVPDPEDLCRPDCPGRDRCLGDEPCVKAENQVDAAVPAR